jgi:CRP-like cAMP-binding protein
MPEEVVFGVANFKKNGYIIIEDQPESGEFFIIRQGNVTETRSAALAEEAQGTVLTVGDFFGVISCMARRARIETVQAIDDTSTIVVQRENFGALIQKNTPIAMKILRYFGKQLRFYDSRLTKLTFQSSLEEDPNNLYNIGEFYYSSQMLTQAAFAYLHYIKFCPDGGFVPQAKMKLAKINPNQDALQPKKEGFYTIYKEGQIIFLEHEPGAELYIIQEGKVKITKLVNNNEVLLAVLKKGDIFGEMSLLDNKPRSASAVAFGPTKLMVVSKSNFEPTVQGHPEIATKIIELLSERIWLIYKQLSNILIKDPLGKIYDALYTQLQKARVPITMGTAHSFDFGTEELIKFVGFTAQDGHVHIKNLFDKDKTLTIVDGKIFCKDVTNIEKTVQIFKRGQELEKKRMAPQTNTPSMY